MSLVSSGEVKQNPLTGSLFTYPGKPNNNDDIVDPSVQPGDENRIFSNKFPFINYVRHLSNSSDKQRKLSQRYNGLSSLQKATSKVQQNVVSSAIKPLEQMQDNMADTANTGYARGKESNVLGIPGWVRAIPTVSSLAAGINQLRWWKGQDIQAPDIYAKNPNASVALNTLASLRDNPYQQFRAMQDVERRNAFGVNNVGGLSGSQRYMARVASGIGMQNNYANALRQSQLQNNQYKSQYATTAAQLGAQDAANRMAANQFGRNDYVGSHGKKVKGYETGIYNMINAGNSGYTNEFKYRMGNKTLDMYQQNLDEEQKRIADLYNKRTNIPSTATYTYVPVSRYNRLTIPAWPTYTEYLKKYNG